MREKKEMKEGRGVQRHTHTPHTHINLSPMAGTVPDQGPGTG